MAAKFGAYGKIHSIAFVTFTTDVLEPCAALPMLKQFATAFHLPASFNAFQLSPSTHIIIVVFFDGRAMSPERH
jgi:cytochrome c oxidase assembly factor CtaG